MRKSSKHQLEDHRELQVVGLQYGADLLNGLSRAA